MTPDLAGPNARYTPVRAWFFLAISAAILLTVFIGFAPSYYLKSFFRGRDLRVIVHLHGAIMSAWVALFAVQSFLVARKNIALHRRLGFAGAMVAGAVVTMGPIVSITFRPD